MTLHVHHIPYRKKLHNIIEYLVLIATLMTLFFGLLFLTNKFDNSVIQTTAVVVSTTLIVLFNSIVIIFVIWDIIIRNRTTTKNRKKKKRIERFKRIRDYQRKKYSGHNDGEDFVFSFNFREFKIDEEDEKIKTMNDIIFDLLSWRRVVNNFKRFKKKRRSVNQKVGRISMSASEFSKSDLAKDDLDPLDKLEEIKAIEMREMSKKSKENEASQTEKKNQQIITQEIDDKNGVEISISHPDQQKIEEISFSVSTREISSSLSLMEKLAMKENEPLEEEENDSKILNSPSSFNENEVENSNEQGIQE
eukprot:gene1372-11994_t